MTSTWIVISSFTFIFTKLFPIGSDIPLNDAGLAGARIASRALLDVPFDLALSSPLARAYKTAEIIAEPHGLTPHRVDLLKEMSFGTFEGTELETENPDPSLEEKRQALRHWFEHPSGTVRLPEGENVRDVKDRVRSFLRQDLIPREKQYACVLVVAHGGIIRALDSVLNDTPDEEFWSGGVLPNCGALVLNLEKGVFTEEARLDLING